MKICVVVCLIFFMVIKIVVFWIYFSLNCFSSYSYYIVFHLGLITFGKHMQLSMHTAVFYQDVNIQKCLERNNWSFKRITCFVYLQLSPFVFVNSEVYKFTEETTPRVGLISYFLTGSKNTDFIKTGKISPP